MLPSLRVACLSLGLVAAVACSDNDPLSSGQPDLAGDPAGTARDGVPVKVMVQNVYVGTDVDAVLTAPPDQLAGALVNALQVFVATDFPARAAAIADRIGRERPDLIALNEMSLVTVQGLGILDPAFNNLRVDFRAILSAALTARGLPYDVAGQVTNTQAFIPVPIDPALPPGLITLTDYDMVLIRRGIPYRVAAAANYTASFTAVLIPGVVEFPIKRGYVAVDADLSGGTVRFVSTHPEPRETDPRLQAAQMAELVGFLGTTALPIIVSGDLNSSPVEPDVAGAFTPYHQLTQAGFRDMWESRWGSHQSQGYTCCHQPDLRNPVPTFRKRIDHVFVKDGGTGTFARTPVPFDLLWDEPRERTESGLWPADHAGLVVTLPLRR